VHPSRGGRELIWTHQNADSLLSLTDNLPNSGPNLWRWRVYIPTLALVCQCSHHAMYFTPLVYRFCCSLIDKLILLLFTESCEIHSCIFRIMFPWLNKKNGMSILRSRPKSGTADPFVCNMIQLRGLERWIWDDFLGSPSFGSSRTSSGQWFVSSSSTTDPSHAKRLIPWGVCYLFFLETIFLLS